MEVSDMIGWIFIIVLVIGGSYALYVIIPATYHEIKSYHIMQEECKINSDICFCSQGSCTIKSSCSYSQMNGGLVTGGCNHTRLCDIFTRANWKEGLWDYDC